MTTQLGAIGKTGAGNAGIGGDATPPDIHIGAARPQAGRNPAFAQIDPHAGKNVQSLLKEFLSRSDSAGVALGIASILGSAIGLQPELRAWCTEKALPPSRNSTIYSPVGFDLTVGGVSTAWEVGIEILSGGREDLPFF